MDTYHFIHGFIKLPTTLNSYCLQLCGKWLPLAMQLSLCSMGFFVICWFVHGGIKYFYIFHKISSVLYGKYNIVVSKCCTVISILACNQHSEYPPLIFFVHLCGFLILLEWIHKDNSKEICPAWYKMYYLEHWQEKRGGS